MEEKRQDDEIKHEEEVHKEEMHKHEHKSEKHHSTAEKVEKKHIEKHYVKTDTVWKVTAGILTIMLIIAIIALIMKNTSKINEISPEEASLKAVDFIKENLLQPGMAATIKGVEEAHSVYKIKMDVAGREIDSYISKDGSLLFPYGFDMNKAQEAPPQQPSAPSENIPKAEKPKVELFVMSHCPFGTQMEKGMLPVVDLLGKKVDWNIRFVNYAMHGQKEVNEQLLQYCIQKEKNDQYFNYLKCFLKEGNTEACLTEVGIKNSDLQKCLDETDKKYDISKNLNDQSLWLNGRFPQFKLFDAENQKYGVQGSPTFVLNEVKLEAQGRDPNSILQSVCAAFSTQPEECKQQLSGTSPSSGFGFNNAPSGGNTAAGCGQ